MHIHTERQMISDPCIPFSPIFASLAPSTPALPPATVTAADAAAELSCSLASCDVMASQTSSSLVCRGREAVIRRQSIGTSTASDDCDSRADTSTHQAISCSLARVPIALSLYPLPSSLVYFPFLVSCTRSFTLSFSLSP